MLAELRETKAAELETKRKRAEAAEAGKLAAASPLHHSRRGKTGAR